MTIVKSKIRFKSYGEHEPYLVVLHHTAGGLIGSESHLKLKGLGYHSMIQSDGKVFTYNAPTDVVGHALKANRGSVGISFVAGGPLGPVTEAQILGAIELINEYKKLGYELTHLSDHATVDIVIAKRKGKSDPQYIGEKVEQNVWEVKYKNLDRIAEATGLETIKIKGY